jgi:hypothetical protein
VCFHCGFSLHLFVHLAVSDTFQNSNFVFASTWLNLWLWGCWLWVLWVQFFLVWGLRYFQSHKTGYECPAVLEELGESWYCVLLSYLVEFISETNWPWVFLV